LFSCLFWCLFQWRTLSHLWLGARTRTFLLVVSIAVALQISPHSREAKFSAWDCKVTPADCACQEGNTICCISNNDGLGAGLGTRFPHALREGHCAEAGLRGAIFPILEPGCRTSSG